MLKSLLARLQQGHRTIAWPDGPPPPLPDRFRGSPALDPTRCPDGCKACANACPTGAIDLAAGCIDLGRCLFCPDCVEACPAGALHHETAFSLAARSRKDLQRPFAAVPAVGVDAPSSVDFRPRFAALDAARRRLFGRSLKLRQVSAGGCNGCEADINVLGTIGWDLGRFGIQLVASPRHADGLLITGPVTENMRTALLDTYAAVPDPKIVVAVGACAISGGPYIDRPETHNGASQFVPVDLFIPGCPPHPLTILDGLLQLLGRLESRVR
ncbi:MAG: hydrogenase [Planctomycetota bacterium]